MMIGTWPEVPSSVRIFVGDLVPVELGQHDVEEDQVRRLGAPQAESLGAVRRDDDVVALLLEGVLQETLDVRVVVDDEDLGRHQSSTERAGPDAARGGCPGAPTSARRL